MEVAAGGILVSALPLDEIEASFSRLVEELMQFARKELTGEARVREGVGTIVLGLTTALTLGCAGVRKMMGERQGWTLMLRLGGKATTQF